jgi:hypothetical protein
MHLISPLRTTFPAHLILNDLIILKKSLIGKDQVYKLCLLQACAILICNRVFLDIVHCLYFNKITTFRKLDLLPSSGKKGQDRNPSCWAPWLS